ncbi:glycosyltransferase family 2 protein [Loigolactobacillus coryniformis]|uniref:glycosyltransferase family 2 protein n=1 Tax=Loigolactobacillus coryniformis TaxID=1610 RepID=UPI0023404FD9|nr:glycosyltransferase family 2 protein [Loigolactobacillus coryniformis]MDC4186159.1 glycosyltransferase family 2 protein [Loigolactobacillus coryniformis]
MSDKIGVGVVLYNPDLTRLQTNITALKKQSQRILLFDNGSTNLAAVKAIYATDTAITITGFDKNRGIAAALNAIMAFFQKKSFDWVLTFDQDSLPPETILADFAPYLSKHEVAIISPAVWDLSENVTDYERTDNPFDYIEQCITSGSLTRVSDWQRVNGYDEKMFIDLVDFDFCRRLILSGRKLIRVNQAVLRQEIGRSKQVMIFSRRIPVDNHSALRKYYQARNSIYYYKKFRKQSDRKVYWDEAKLYIKTLFFEQDKGPKLKSISKGIRAGIKMPAVKWQDEGNLK